MSYNVLTLCGATLRTGDCADASGSKPKSADIDIIFHLFQIFQMFKLFKIILNHNKM